MAELVPLHYRVRLVIRFQRASAAGSAARLRRRRRLRQPPSASAMPSGRIASAAEVARLQAQYRSQAALIDLFQTGPGPS